MSEAALRLDDIFAFVALVTLWGGLLVGGSVAFLFVRKCFEIWDTSRMHRRRAKRLRNARTWR